MPKRDWNETAAALSRIAGTLKELSAQLATATEPMPAYEVLYGPGGAVVSDLTRARLEMGIAAHAGSRPADPRLN